MNELLYLGPGQVRWREAPEPELLTGSDALVRPIAVATCDLDTQLLRGHTPFPGPFPLGQEGICEVVAVPDEVGTVTVGDLGSCRSRSAAGAATGASGV